MIDWTPTYLVLMQPVAYRPAELMKWQGANPGGCFAGTTCYMMEMRALIMGYPPRQLSQIYNAWTDGGHNDSGTDATSSLGSAQFGVCIESLLPAPSYAGVDTTTHEYDLLIKAAITTPPPAVADADASNQTLTDWVRPPFMLSPAAIKIMAQTAIAAGYPIAVITATQRHVEVGLGFDVDGVIVLDTRSQNREPGHISWNQISGIAGIVRGVRYANAVLGPPLTVPPVTPPVVVLPPPPPPVQGNTQMLIDGIKTKASALTLGQITQAQIDALKSDVSALIPDAGIAVPPPGGQFVNDIGVGQSFVSTAGDTWSIDAPNIIKVNGRSAYGVYGTRIIEDSTGKVKGRRDTGGGTFSWQIWMGGGGWKQTTAP